ncbi:Rha family transcriptional regulator [Solidesulfovibrio sp.]|uniref:Rha family transcriptional regulator n=1 Tax=Solidesulfovibrio sp. TaxID=2910990 RepID=UPI002B1FD3CE|nr:Rha family transcriptional regulator [Solidesulfovibrio sp.]MEA5087290.1 Rha family transcriptional regulator [Solidesulfovibrio sp.]
MSQSQIPNLPVSIEFLPGERPAVRSVDVARHFGLKHKNVLQDIKNLTAKVPESFNGLNFQPVTYRDEKGEERPCYLLTRDAFTLLVMGWNSARAIEWKLRYIQAFNALEAAALENARAEAVAAGARAAMAFSGERLDRIGRAVAYRRKGLSCRDIAKLLDTCTATASQDLRDARRLGLLAAPARLPQGA